MAQELKYIRTDKNGTKIFYDWNCPRCGGAGMCDKWINTGRVCYACGGSGKRTVAKIVKEYTPEYFEKLQARRIARAEKYAEDHAEEIAKAKEEQDRIARENLERTFKEFGCSADGVGYVLTGNTYPVKEEIKENGGRWISYTWVCPTEISFKGVNVTKINLNDYINEYGLLDRDEAFDAIWQINKRMSKR